MGCCKRGCNSTSSSSSSKWADIRSEILDSILERLSFLDVLVCKCVCSHWCSSAKSFITFKSQTPQVPRLFLFPPANDLKPEELTESCCIISWLISENTPEELTKSSCCIGSSHGWLIFLDERAVPLLFHLSLLLQIGLPRIDSFFGLLKIKKYPQDGYLVINNDQEKSMRFVRNLREILIHKAILSSDPCLGINCFGAVVIYKDEMKLAYCKNGDNSWRELDGKQQPYEDIICSGNKLYALGSLGSVEVWDMDGVNQPVKRIDIELTFPEKKLMIFFKDFGKLYYRRMYLVKLKGGDIILVVRFVGFRVDEYDEPVYDDDYFDEVRPLVYPYKTLAFHVYKLDLGQKSWKEVDSLGDEILFLGGNC